MPNDNISKFFEFPKWSPDEQEQLPEHEDTDKELRTSDMDVSTLVHLDLKGLLIQICILNPHLDKKTKQWMLYLKQSRRFATLDDLSALLKLALQTQRILRGEPSEYDKRKFNL